MNKFIKNTNPLNNLNMKQMKKVLSIVALCMTILFFSKNANAQCSGFNVTLSQSGDGSSIGDAVMIATVTGGSGTVAFGWSGSSSAFTNINNNTASGYTGNYCVTAVDSILGCIDTSCITVTDTGTFNCANLQSSVYVNDSCQYNDIDFHASAWGGSGSYSYAWNTGQTSSSIYNKPGGTYTVIITDLVYGCKDTIVKTEIDDTCNVCQNFNNNGYISENDGCVYNDITLTVQKWGGSYSYFYLWNTGATTSSISNKSSGSYSCIVTDTLYGCKDTLYITVADDTCNPCASFQANIYEMNDPCGLNDVTLSAYPQDSFGSTNYTYIWNTGATTKNMFNKTTGSYWAIVTNTVTGCADSAYIYVSDDTCNPCANFYAQIYSYDSCQLNDGMADVYAYGGSGNYSYLWSNGSTNSSIFNQSSGIVSVTITDITNNCTIIKQDTIVDDTCNVCTNFNNNGYISENDLCFQNDITLTAQKWGGSYSYSYLWNTGATSQSISNKSAGSYSCIITDNIYGCKDTLYIAVADDTCNPCSSFQAYIYEMSDPCGLNDVMLSAYPQDSLGSTNYTYLWNTGATTKSLLNKTSGFYWVKVMNTVTGCIDTAYLSVSDDTCNPCANFYSYIYKDDSCQANDLKIYAYGYGGSGNYTYLWNNGSTASYLVNKPTGLYRVTITDVTSGCVRVDSIFAIDSNFKCCSAYFWVNDNGSATKNFYSISDSSMGATTSHNWSFGNGNSGTGSSTSQTYTAGGTYTVCHMITTVSNCKDTFCLTVNAPTPGRNLKVTHYGIPYVKDTNRYLYIMYQNIGTTTESGIIEYKYPVGMTLTYSSISPLSNVGNKLTFSVGSLAPGVAGSIYIQMHTPTSFVLGSIKCDTAIILPIASDINVSNNTSFDCDSVVSSYDPNEKMANPSGIGEEGRIAPTTKEINYLINFQNEGNFRTYRVRVEDEIDPSFDINTLMIGDISHSYRMVKIGNKLVWYFDNIELTPKSQDEKRSKGYIQYTLKLKSNLPIGTQIKNTAFIYFDANPAIVTNTTKNTLKNAGGNAAVSDLNQAKLDFDATVLNDSVVITSAEKMDNIRLYDMNGRLLIEQSAKSKKAELNTSVLSNQIYIIHVDMGESTVVKKFQF
jgi:hypothetical protein